MRTPLQTIMSALELADPADRGERDRERQQEAIAAAASLRDLFDGLLELAECEVGSIELRPVTTDLEQLADDLARRWRPRLTGRGLLLVPESHGAAVVDPVRLAQIADALLDNAVKFARPGTVALRLVAVDDESGSDPAVELELRDSGPGVAPEDRDRMFGPFVRVHGGNDRAVSGAGIGLALVRGLARQMGGDAVAGTADDGGLVVSVRIPGGAAA